MSFNRKPLLILILSVLIFICGSSDTNRIYVAITVPSIGTITVKSSFTSGAIVAMVYDDGGADQNLPLTNNGTDTLVVSKAGKVLVSFASIPVNFVATVIMPNNGRYIVRSMGQFSSAIVSTGSCQDNFLNFYANQLAPPECKPICRTIIPDGSSVTSKSLCLGNIYACQISCQIVHRCGNGVIDSGQSCDVNSSGCTNCQIDAGYFCDQVRCQPIGSCGDGIKQSNEQCDNGNKEGCIGCVIQVGYDCYGLVGSSSICPKKTGCGNAVRETGQQCDNGNKLGCKESCIIDGGYSCTGAVGQTSSCSKCGNNIIESGQQCDNGGQAGCKGCTIDAGYQCAGAPSVCVPSNPVCGNGVNEIGESCDDGNNKNGDGCSNKCTIQTGYNCYGDLQQISKCLPITLTLCGDNSFDPKTESCDNGMKAGCRKCTIDAGWTCVSTPGKPSICSILGAPSCGDGLWDPSNFEDCDDGNVKNGDGCSAFCKIQAYWTCPNHTNCYSLNNPHSQIVVGDLYCGNGKVETEYGEECDDFNKKDGDGCSSLCKIDKGWSCSGRYCQKLINGFCGDGITEDNQECDDGFPVLNGDGCSRNCKVEPGWYCMGVCIDNFEAISRCYKKIPA